MKFSRGLFSRELVLILFSTVLISFLTVSAQEAYADIVFNDPFDLDPATNGWTEKIVQFPVDNFPATATGDIIPNGEGQVVLKKTGKASALELSITRTIDTTGFDNIKLALTAKQSTGNYEWADFIRIEYNIGDGFVTLLEDHEVWNGKNDLSGEGTPVDDGNTKLTSTEDLRLPEGADNNDSLKVRLTVFLDEVNEDIYFDNFMIKGDEYAPLTVKDLTDALKVHVNDYLDKDDAKKLTKNLDNVLKALDKDKIDKACKELDKFIQDVDKLVKKEMITQEKADQLITAAQNIKDKIGCS